MVEASLVGSAALSAAVMLAIFVALVATRHRHPTLVGEGGIGTGYGYGDEHDLQGWAGTANALFAAFSILTLGAFGFVFAYLRNGAEMTPLFALAVATLGLGVVFGAYAVGRNAGIGSAGATLVTATVIGILLVLIVSARLLSG